MPHLELERLRSWPTGKPSESFGDIDEANTNCAYPREILDRYAIEIVDVIGGLLFVIGSTDFLPHYSEDPLLLVHGCEFYTVGGFLYLSVSSWCFYESYVVKGGFRSLETCQSGFYLMGCLLFLLGTVLYWPHALIDDDESALYSERALKMGVGLPVYLNTMSPCFEGTILFITGSVFFALAAFANGLNIREFHDVRCQLLTATTSFYMMGAIFFIMGSVAFLPDLGCNKNMENFGGWCYIIGSCKYTLGAIISLVRTVLEYQNEERFHLKFHQNEEQKMFVGP